MGKHDPRRVHWAKILKLVRAAGKEAIAVYDLCEEMGLEKSDPNVEDAVIQLLRQGKIRQLLGRSKDGMPCRVLQIKDEEVSKRELLGEDVPL